MGVSGSGKTTLGEALAARLDLPCLDADDVHPAANVAKMSAGHPLNDDDRWPWLSILCTAMNEAARSDGGIITACSALKRRYRDFIRSHLAYPVQFILLDGDRATLHQRMQNRPGHYMPPTLLDSQIADLEKPAADEQVLSLSIEHTVDELVMASLSAIQSATKETHP